MIWYSGNGSSVHSRGGRRNDNRRGRPWKAKGSLAGLRASCGAFLIIVALIGFDRDNATRAADVSKSDTATEDRVQALIPDMEAYIARGMQGFDVPGLALGIVAGDKLIYAKGFGVRSKSGGLPVDTRTIFQIGSNAKAFLAATEAIMVDRGRLRWTIASSISIRNFR